MNYLFSYGTIQQEKIQLELYGRILKGQKDVLPGYAISFVENKDPVSLAKGDENIHRLAIPSYERDAMIEGTVFELSEEELLLTDKYEPGGFKRVSVTLLSGKHAWVYVAG